MLSIANSFTIRQPQVKYRMKLQGSESEFTTPIRPFADHDALLNLVNLSSQALPGASDGVILVAKYSDSASEARLLNSYDQWGNAVVQIDEGYERLAVEHPSCIFMQCDSAFVGSDVARAAAKVSVLPTFHIYYKNNKVGRVEGPKYSDLEGWIARYSFQYTKGDNSEKPNFLKNRVDPWGDGRRKDTTITPQTTGRFVPGYDLDSEEGFFDKTSKKFEKSFDDIFGKIYNEEEEGPQKK